MLSASSPDGGHERPDETVVYAFFESSVERTKGKIGVHKRVPVMYYGRLSREKDSETLQFDGYSLEGRSIRGVMKKVAEKRRTEFYRQLTEQIKQNEEAVDTEAILSSFDKEVSSENVRRLYISGLANVAATLGAKGKEEAREFNIRDIKAKSYVEFYPENENGKTIIDWFTKIIDAYKSARIPKTAEK